MFVVNCEIKDKKVFPRRNQKRKRNKRERMAGQAAEASSQSGEAVRQVCCSVCSTEVGVIDEDEVYHFYDVLPSES